MDALLPDTSTLLPSSHPSAPPARRSHFPSAPHWSGSSAARSASSPQLQQPLGRPSAPLPLPLPSSRSLLPSPLRFLWFRGSDPQRPGSDPSSSFSHASLAEQLDEISDDIWTCTCDERSNSLAQSAGEFTEENDELDVVLVPEFSESGGEDCSSRESIEALASTAVNEHQESTRDGAAKGWISRFLDLKSFWKDLRSLQLAAVDRLGGVRSENAKSDVLEKACHVACDLPKCVVEEARQRVVHNKESVAAFLQEVPMFEMKTILHLCSVSNLAYIIPRIETRELFKHHRLMFITSSLEKKAEADSQARNRPTTKKRGSKWKEFKALQYLVAADGEPSESDPVGAAKRTALTLAVESEHMATNEFAGKAMVQDAEKVLNKACTSEFLQEEFVEEPVTSSRKLTDSKDRKIKQSPSEKETSSIANCPCEWFIGDDQSSHTRYLMIQGSESLASWQTNLAIDPMRFEELGTLVHRGVYEAAKGLYDMVLPEILDHLRAHGELALLRFTGHSLGGSLATLLALMLVSRGVVKPNALLPVVTFGAPYVLCGGDSLLQKLKMKKSQFLSVVMHRDIVPRAFTCDYPDSIAQILKRLNGKFRNHSCLNHQKLLYAPMGQMLILQPDPTHSPGHPLLPSGVGFYFVRSPSNEQDENNAVQLIEAQRAFMNMPHPLEVLRDPGAYGFEGAISRDHDPRSYARALKVVTRLGMKKIRRQHRDLRRQLWWPLLTADASLLAQKAGVNADSIAVVSGAASPALSRYLKGRREMVTCATAQHCEFPRSSTGLTRSRTATLHRYARLIASRHVHVGLLLILSTRIVNLDVFSALLAWI